MSGYSRYAEKAYEKIRMYGSPVTLMRSGGRTYDKETNSYVCAGDGVAGYAVQSGFDQRNVDGTNIRLGDIMLTAVLGEAPRSNDTVAFGGRTYTVVDVSSLSPDGKTDIYYRIHAR